MASVIIMPKQGLLMEEGTITNWLVKEGEKTTEGTPLFEMETDKLTITIDSSFTGTLLKIIRGEGEEVPITEPIALIGNPGDSTSGFTAPARASGGSSNLSAKSSALSLSLPMGTPPPVV